MTSLVTGARLPLDVERGAVGGPRFDTTVLELDGGGEKRNVNWIDTRGEWSLGFGLIDRLTSDPGGVGTDLEKILSLFNVVQGRAFTFVMRDWLDYRIALEVGDVPQFVALGDGATTTFQLIRRYTAGTGFYDRLLTKIDISEVTPQIFVNSVLDGTATFDADRGLLTPTAVPGGPGSGGDGPGGEDLVGFKGEFLAHVRFDTDALKISLEILTAGEVPNLPIVEVLGNGID